MGRQQTTLFVLLIAGLGAYFGVAWWLYALGAIGDSSRVNELHSVALHLYLPYIGLAVGGVFGVKKLGTNSRVDLHVFVIAVAAIGLWDVLAVGNLLLTDFSDAWQVEDVVHFDESVMQALSILPAAAIGFYFGAQSEQPAPSKSTTAQ
jgi:hypothetical protein